MERALLGAAKEILSLDPVLEVLHTGTAWFDIVGLPGLKGGARGDTADHATLTSLSPELPESSWRGCGLCPAVSGEAPKPALDG